MPRCKRVGMRILIISGTSGILSNLNGQVRFERSTCPFVMLSHIFHFLAVFIGAYAGIFFEFLIEPIYFRIADAMCDFIDFEIRFDEQTLCFLHALLQQIFVECHLLMPFELLSEISAVKMQFIGDLFERDVLMQRS